MGVPPPGSQPTGNIRTHIASLRGRRLKGKAKVVCERNARGARGGKEGAFLSRLKLPFPKIPFPSLLKRRPRRLSHHRRCSRPTLACSRLSNSGEDAKEKGTRKVGGAGKRKKEVRRRPCSP